MQSRSLLSLSSRARFAATMQANRLLSISHVVGGVLLLAFAPSCVRAATVETSNFRVTAETRQMAGQIALLAEDLRLQLANDWLGNELPNWEHVCIVRVDTTAERMTGSTTFEFTDAGVRGWRMSLRGPLVRIVESLLPHEIAHTILATHFRRAVPRWADEGIALMAEDELDRRRVRAMVKSSFASGRLLPIETLLDTDEYPADKQQLRLLYSQSASLTEFLLISGRRSFLKFVAAGMEHDWTVAIRQVYGFASLDECEQHWHAWEQSGRPEYSLAGNTMLADAVRNSDARRSPNSQRETRSSDSVLAAMTAEDGRPRKIATASSGGAE